jgi:hypothetical protein
MNNSAGDKRLKHFLIMSLPLKSASCSICVTASLIYSPPPQPRRRNEEIGSLRTGVAGFALPIGSKRLEEIESTKRRSERRGIRSCSFHFHRIAKQKISCGVVYGFPSAQGAHRILYRDGVPIAVLEAGQERYLVDLEKAAEWPAKKALIHRPVPPQLKAYLGRSA